MTEAMQLEWLMDAHVEILPPVEVGNTPTGVQRAIPLGGGHIDGPHLRGTVIPGAADWQIIRSDGVAMLDVTGAMLTHDKVIIRVSTKALRHGSSQVMQRLAAGEQVPPGEYYMRGVTQFHAPAGAYEWLNKSLFVMWGERYESEVVIHYYRVL